MKYELCFIISPLVPETEHTTIKQTVLGLLKDIKAEIKSEPYFIGRKKLAYPIAKQKHGFYVFLEFSLEEKNHLKDFELKLRHDKHILRHLIIKKEGAKAQKSKIDPSRFADAPEAKQKIGLRKKRTDFGLRRAPMAKEQKSRPIDAKQEVKIELGDMSQKLDEILEKGPKID